MDKKDSNEGILQELMTELYRDNTYVLLKEKLQSYNLNFYENAYVCMKCFQIY